MCDSAQRGNPVLKIYRDIFEYLILEGGIDEKFS